jgi:hypothetical protein
MTIGREKDSLHETSESFPESKIAYFVRKQTPKRTLPGIRHQNDQPQDQERGGCQDENGQKEEKPYESHMIMVNVKG